MKNSYLNNNMYNLKKYTIGFGICNKNNNNRVPFRYTKYNDEKINILNKIEYYCNYNYTKIQDLKEYICQIFNKELCPCFLKICNNQYYEDKNYLLKKI